MDLFGDDDDVDLGEIFEDAGGGGGGGDSGGGNGGGGGGVYVPAPSSPRQQRFSGLLNQGNTCYLNSLIASLYATPEVRKNLYTLTPEQLVVQLEDNTVAETDKDAAAAGGGAAGAGASAASAPAQPDQGLDSVDVDALMGMGFGEAQVRRAIRRFPFDPDNMQRVEFILSGDADQEDASEKNAAAAAAAAAAEAAEAAKASKRKERRIPKELQMLFARMQVADTNAQSTKRLTDCFGAGFSAGVQHDVHELNRILFDRIEKQLRGTPIQTMFNDLYRGTIVNRIVCESCGHKSEREEDFLDVSLIVGDFTCVQESFASYVLDEILEGANKYQCSGCKQMVVARKGARFRALPPVLIVSLSRFEYDKQTWARVKNSKRFEFPRVLDMSPYVEAVNGGDLQYDLFGVVIHRGHQAGYGHYHAYLRDVLNESGWVGTQLEHLAGKEDSFEGWFDFNDSFVRPIASATVDSQFGGDPNQSECAYMLVYRQKDSRLLMKAGEAPPVVPPHLADVIQQENSAALQQRADYERLKNSIQLSVFSTSALDYTNDGGLKLREDEESDDETDVKEPAFRDRGKIVIDRRATLKELKERAMAVLGPFVPPTADVIHMHKVRFLGPGKKVKFLRPLEKPLSADGKELTFDDSAVLDTLATVTHGSDILVWDGEHLADGEPYEVQYDLITLCVTFYDDDGSSRKLDVMVKESATLGEFRAVLEKEGLGKDLWLFRIDYGRVSELSEDNKTLHELYLLDHVKVSAERRSPDKVSMRESKLAAALRDSEDKLELIVVNNCDSTPGPTVSANLGMTIWDLKQAIVKKIGTLNERMAMRLRRTTPLGGEDDLFPDEGSSLRKAGLGNSMRVIIEYGEPPDAAQITVKYTWGTPSGQKLLDEMQSICVEVTCEIGVLKQRIMNNLRLESNASTMRLRKTDFWGNQKEIFDDESVTLKGAGFKDCDCVWLEEGSLPPRGHMEIQIELQTPCFDAKNAGEVWAISPVGTLHVAKTATLAELRAVIESDPTFKSVVGDRAYRLWSKQRLLRGLQKTLKKAGVLASSAIQLELLPEGATESPDLISDTGVVLLIRERLSESKSFSEPVQKVVAAQKRGNQHFITRKQLMSVIFGGLEATEPVIVAKMVAQSGKWRVLIDPTEEAEAALLASTEPAAAAAPAPAPAPTETSGGGARSLHKKQQERKKADEIFLGDEELIVFKRLKGDPNSEDDFVHMLNRTYGQLYTGSLTVGGAKGSVGVRERVKEVSLQIEDDEFWQ